MRFNYQSKITAPQEKVFQWHLNEGALERMLPQWEDIRILYKDSPPVSLNSEVVLSVPLALGLRKKWVAQHIEVSQPREFQDIQLSGPFRSWHHTHRFESETGGKETRLHDQIDFSLPLPLLSHLLVGRFVRQKLNQQFRYRHAVLQNDLRQLQLSPIPPQTILVTGSSGLIGRSLTAFLRAAGHTVRTLVRREPESPHEFRWDIKKMFLDPDALRGVSTVVHLAGEPIARRRWSKRQKKRIRDSRIHSTRLLVRSFEGNPPATFVCASAIGIYGDTGLGKAHEDSEPGFGFLAKTCLEWEATAATAKHFGVRVIHPRIGVVLSPSGGALQKMLPPFKAGFGGKIGSGNQLMSWITLDDLLYGLYFLLASSDLEGPFNMVSPHCLSNKEFTKTLAKVLHRPALLPLPAVGVKALFGEMGKALLLQSSGVIPNRLQEAGFQFCYPYLRDGLKHILGR